MSTTAESMAGEWRDRKRYLWSLSFLYPLFPIPAIALAYATGIGAVFWLPVLSYYLLVPLVDHLVGEDPNNPTPEAVERLNKDRYYRWMLYATVPGHFLSLLVASWVVASGHWGLLPLIGLTLTIGVVGGLAINTGHELGHKKELLPRTLAKLVLTTVGYGHFFIEHNKGHHRDVATPEDPASARMGENIYTFAMREIPGAARRAWRLERDHMRRMGRHPFSLHNEIVQTTLGTALLYGGIILAFGPITIPFLLGQTIYGWWQLSFANFVEHYGLKRRKQDDGRYERVQPEHSWNTNHVVSNLLTFHLQRHSDHHAHPTRWYHTLRHYEGVPSLPSGYPGMYLVAMVPPLWHRIMDPRVLAHYGHDLDRVNVSPRKRDKLYQRHHRPQAA